VGALYVRRKNPRVKLKPLLYGGGHEKGLRSGTLNVPGIVGLGKACALAGQLLHSETERLAALRNQLLDGLLETGCCTLNGNRSALLPHVANLSFSIPAANQLITRLQPQLALSSGSACSSALSEPSHVLKAMGCSDAAAAGSIRFSLGRFTTEEDIRFAVEAVKKLVGGD
jgi:cysteine desulfurase